MERIIVLRLPKKHLAITATVIFQMFVFTNCGAESFVLDFNEEPRSCVAHEETDWGYYGQVSNPRASDRKPILLPLDWGRQFEDCGHMYAPMHRQSPIELPTLAEDLPPETKVDIVFGRYSAQDFVAENNCHTVQATPLSEQQQTESAIMIAGKPYRLLQFHMHTPSEHVFDTGEHGTVNYPIELHFVHAAVGENGRLDSNQLAVVGLFLDIAHGDVKPERTVDTAIATMALNLRAVSHTYAAHNAQTTAQQTLSIDLNELLVNHTEHIYHYRGSLTTPPCSEVVEWLVLAKPAVISVATYQLVQARKLDVGFANNRPPIPATPAHRLRYKTPQLFSNN